MLFHPTTLKLLYEWKMSPLEEVPLDLLALIIGCKPDVDYGELDDILYKYKKVTRRKKQRMESMREIIASKFVLETISQDDIGKGGHKTSVYSLCNHSEVPKSISKLLSGARRKIGKKGGTMKHKDAAMPEMSAKGSKGSGDMLKFIRKEGKREKVEVSRLGPFTPIHFDDNVVLSGPRTPVMNTLRMRKDIQDARKLLFVKFSDQLKPPIYRFRTDRLNIRNSLSRIPQVLDYECDSDWEEEEDAESIDSTEGDSDEMDEGDYEWIDSDVENVELAKSNKKPSVTFPPCEFIVVASFPGPWLQLPLIERDVFPEECLEIFRQGLADAKHVGSFVKEFGRRYVIKLHVVNKKLRDLGLSKDENES